MPRPQDGPTYEEAIKKILRDVSHPIPAQALAEMILATRSSAAKNPMQSVRAKIREFIGCELIFLDADTILPVRLALQGARFRVQLERSEVEQGLVNIGNYLTSYLPIRYNFANVIFVEADGQIIEAQSKTVTKKSQSFLGDYNESVYYANLSGWLRKNNFSSKDYLLFTIMDREKAVFKLERESYGRRNEKALQQRNQMLADIFYEMLENSSGESVYIKDGVPTAYARLPEKDGYPPDHWAVVVQNDKRMRLSSWEILYSDGRKSMFDEMMDDVTGENEQKISNKPVSKEQGERVYQFKAELKGGRAIWREIEIQGKQTLADLNSELVHAFGHDFDHLGGFWRLVHRKGTTRGVSRYREVDLGSVDPFGGGDAANITIAELGFSAGDKMKYVFDFGDWIEHELTLESIEAPKPDETYPREARRNKPKYVNCVECLKNGKEITAVWVCATCSHKAHNEIVLCEKCAEKHQDKEHYTDKILY